MLDERGQVFPARVDPAVPLLPGPTDGCGHRVTAAWSALPMEAPLFDWEWTVQLDCTADRDGVVTVDLGTATPVEARVREGAHSLVVRLVGGGRTVEVTSATTGLRLCVISGVVGTSERLRRGAPHPGRLRGRAGSAAARTA